MYKKINKTKLMFFIVTLLVIGDLLSTHIALINGATETNNIIGTLAASNIWMIWLWLPLSLGTLFLVGRFCIRFDMEKEYRSVLIMYVFILICTIASNIVLIAS